MTNIQPISKAYLCSNCGACSAVCPKGAIAFRSTSIGRLYAQVDDKCVDCSLCVNVCPSVHCPEQEADDGYVGHVESVYVGRTTDEDIFRNAQSGGACTAILAYLFDVKAIDCALVCRMSFGNPPVVEGVLVTDKKQLAAAQKSCYTPVELLGKLREAKGYQSIALVGLPCHIQGMTNLLSTTKMYRNVTYKLGLVCDRTLCGSIQDVMLSFVGASEYKIDWRRKDFSFAGSYHPYKEAPVVVYEKPARGGVNVMPNSYRFALKDMFTSPRCRVCFDKLNVSADIVLGDPWGMSDVDWNHGASLLITRTCKGEKLITDMQQAGCLSLTHRPLDELLKGQHVDDRKRQVAVFSRALSVLPFKTDSYLYSQETTRKVDEKAVEKAKEEFTAFVGREKKSKEEIVLEARGKIKSHCRRMRLQRNIIYRILRKLKNIIIR